MIRSILLQREVIGSVVNCPHQKCMQRAIAIANQTSLIDKAGGPFGCVIAKSDEIIAEGFNRVIADQDPTSHGEMNAIRLACEKLGTHDLSGCVLYTTGEPCPMCYAACCWARIDLIYYASTYADANKYGDFDDQKIFDSFQKPIEMREIKSKQLMRNEMLELWQEFSKLPEKPTY